jgi:ribosome-binding factor A
MKKGEIRDSQLATMIAEELDYVLSSANDRRLSNLMVTGVQPKPGGGHFIVYVAPSEDSDRAYSVSEMKAVLKGAAGFLRSELASLLNLKRVPDLTFVPDPLCLGPGGGSSGA